MRPVLASVVLACGVCGAACGGASSQTAGVEAPVVPVSFGGAPAPPAAKAYTIHLSRPSHVGERTHVVVDLSEDSGTSIAQGDQVDEKHEKRVTHFDAVAMVAAVDEKGRTTRSRYEVKELLVDGRPLVHGLVDVTNAPTEEDATILVDGAPADKDQRKALQSLLKLRLGGATDDEVFGTTTPQPVGAHWPINGLLAREDLKDNSGIDAQSVTGEAWLQGTANVNDVDCLDVRAKLGLDLNGKSLPGLPPNSTMELGHADAEMTAVLPIDGRMERLTDHLSMTMAVKVRVSTPNGPATVVIKFNRTEDKRYSPP
jgi:hypothetical protein